MVDLSSSKDAIRAVGHRLFCKMSVYVGSTVWHGSVSTTPSAGLISLAVSGSGGSSSNVRAGMKVEIKTSGGLSKGFTRVRFSGTIDSTHLPIREWAQGQIQISSGDLFYVYSDVPLSDKLTLAEPNFEPDGVTFNENMPPVACSGGAWGGTTAMLPIPMSGVSYTTADGSGGTMTHLWTLPAGLSFASGSSSSANPSITGPAGTYLVQHKVTDNDNSRFVTQYVPIVIHDDSSPAYDVVIDSPQGSADKGYSTKVNVYYNADLTSIPDGSLVILWKEEYINGTLQSFGQKASGRNQIIMIAYIRREQGEKHGKENAETLSFELISPLARLEEIVGYSKAIDRDDDSPTSWQQMIGLSSKRALILIAASYTTLIESGFDLNFTDDYVDYDYPAYYIQKSNPLAQIREIADGTDAEFIEDRSGHFEVHTRPDLVAITDRSSYDVVMTLDDDDIEDFQYTREHWRPVEILEARGFSSSTTVAGTAPLFSRWPGLAPGTGTDNPIVERLICASQTNLNQRCGRRGAAADGIYVDANGVLQHAIDIEITLRGAYDVFEFYNQYIAINYTTSKRQLDFGDHLYVLQSTQVEYNQGTATTTIRLRTATNSVSGATYIPPNDTDIPNYTPPIIQFPITPQPTVTEPDFVIPDGDDPLRMWAVTQNGNHIAYTTAYNHTSGTATWALADNTSIVTGTYLDGISDPWNFARRFVLTTTGLWACDDIFVTPDTWYLVADEATITGTSGVYGHRVIMSINRKKFISIAFSRFGVAVSFDYGATWTRRNITGGAVETTTSGTVFSGQQSLLAVSQNNNPGASGKGWIWSGYGTIMPGGTTTDLYLYLSKDWGLTWTRTVTIGPYGIFSGLIGGFINIPYKREGGAENADDNSQYVVSYGQTGGIRRNTAAGASTALSASGNPRDNGGPLAMTSYTFDGNYLATVSEGSGSSPATPNLFTSDNGGGSWTFRQTWGDAGHQFLGMNGWPNTPNYLLWWSHRFVYYSADRGVTKHDLTGNLRTIAGANINPIIVEWDLSSYLLPP